MESLLLRAMNLAQSRSARYADIRVVHHTAENISLKNGRVETLLHNTSAGFGVRVLIGNAWGFAAGREVTKAEIDRVTELACQIATASAHVATSEAVDLGPPVSSRGTYTTPVQIDPFSISPEEKIQILMAADKAMSAEKLVKVRQGDMVAIKEHRHFANTEGAFTEQTIYEMGGGIYATAVNEDEIQRRSYPAPMGSQQATAGWEAALNWDLPGNGERVAAEAVQLLTADPCPRDITTTVIIGSEQLALQIHESCGHPIELDRVFGTEAALAGTSFLTTEKLNNYQYGSEVVNITADSVRPFGLGTFGWDDEGIPAQSTPIVKDGRFVGYLMSRETASKLGTVSNGCMRASSWNRIPLIRMTNVSIEPGNWSFGDLIADTDEGIYMEYNRSWSIDDRRYNFQFGTEIGYEIKKGKLGRLLRNCTYTGITPEFWNSCDAVCGEENWTMWGTPNCGKGQPGQVAHTGHGAAPARFRNVQVGIV